MAVLSNVCLLWRVGDDCIDDAVFFSLFGIEPFVAFHVFVNPLMVWMWIGGLVAIFGTIMALWPTEAERAVVPLPEMASIPAGERRQARMRGAEGGR